MNTQQIAAIENTFKPSDFDINDYRPATPAETQQFLNDLNNYKMQSHVELFWFMKNSGAFDTACPF